MLGYLPFLISLLMGILLILLLWPYRISSSFQVLFLCAAGWGIGCGVSSILYSVLLIFNGPLYVSYFLELGLLGLLGILIWRRNRKRVLQALLECRPDDLCIRPTWMVYCLWLAAGLALVGQIVMFLKYVHAFPVGSADALIIWNYKARAMFFGHHHWLNAYMNTGFGHPQYPLLLPAFIAKTWMLCKTPTELVSVIVGAAFYTSLLITMFCGLVLLKDYLQGLVAVIVLLSTPYLTGWSASQTAFIVVTFYIVSAVVLLTLLDRCKVKYEYVYLLPGLLLGFAVWSKNEGLLVAVIVLGVRGMWVICNRMKEWRSWVWLLVGVIPCVVLTIYFKAKIAPQDNYNFLPSELSVLFQYLTDVSRYQLIVVHLGQALKNLGQSAVIPLVAVVGVYAVLMGIDVHNRMRDVLLSVTVLCLLTGYVVVFVVIDFNLEWHLRTALHRLLLQLYPLVLFAVLCLIRSPARWMVNSSDNGDV